MKGAETEWSRAWPGRESVFCSAVISATFWPEWIDCVVNHADSSPVSTLPAKTSRSTPIVKRVGFIPHCDLGEQPPQRTTGVLIRGHCCSIAQSFPTLQPHALKHHRCTVLHQLPELAQTHVPQVSDATQPSHPLSSPSPPAFNLSQHQGLFQWVSSLHQVAKVLEFQLQHQSFQWIFRIDLL